MNQQHHHFVSARRLLAAAVLPAMLGLGGCVYHDHRPGPGGVEIVDEHGYHHQGYRDAQGWHGGYYDEGHAFHPDGPDWAGDRR